MRALTLIAISKYIAIKIFLYYQQNQDEGAREIVTFYKSNQPEILGHIKQYLYEYLLIRSPGNSAIRSELALNYVESLQFKVALAEAKKVIAFLQDKYNSTLTAKEQAALLRPIWC